MTTAAVLAIAAHADRTSPTRRGQYVRERVLCEFVPPPPANFPLKIDESGELPADATLREKLAKHREDAFCAGCHAAVDPIGLGLEDFDAIGQFRPMEQNRPVDASGELDGTEFVGGRELGEVLEGDPRVLSCVVKQLYRNASGRLEEAGETVVVKDLAERLDGHGGSLLDVLPDLVASEGFRYLRAQAGTGEPDAAETETPSEGGL
jgi:hypothetical protein